MIASEKFCETCRKLNAQGVCNNDCCGVVPFKKEVWEKHKQLVNNFSVLVEMDEEIMFKDVPCVFLQEGKCAIYADRPDVCKRYGCKELPCPWIKPSGRLRSGASRKQVLREQGEKANVFMDNVLRVEELKNKGAFVWKK